MDSITGRCNWLLALTRLHKADKIKSKSTNKIKALSKCSVTGYPLLSAFPATPSFHLHACDITRHAPLRRNRLRLPPYALYLWHCHGLLFQCRSVARFAWISLFIQKANNSDYERKCDFQTTSDDREYYYCICITIIILILPLKIYNNSQPSHVMTFCSKYSKCNMF